MPLTWHRRPIVGFDVATTGSDPETARITAAAVVRYGGGRDTEVRSWAITAHGRAPAAAVIDEVLTALTARVDAGWPLVICDAPFALTVLEREAARYGLVPLSVRAETACVLDPRVLDKQVDRYRPGNRALEDLCQHWRVKIAGSEPADRAKASCAVVWKLANRHRRLTRPGLPELHRRQMQWATEQQNELRAYLAGMPGSEHLADGVRHGWPYYVLSPAAKL